MVRIPNATYELHGSKRCVHLRAFEIDRTEVTATTADASALRWALSLRSTSLA